MNEVESRVCIVADIIQCLCQWFGKYRYRSQTVVFNTVRWWHTAYRSLDNYIREIIT